MHARITKLALQSIQVRARHVAIQTSVYLFRACFGSNGAESRANKLISVAKSFGGRCAIFHI
ncbi:hypothetical protein HMPREF2772_18480 [Achromobacter xylosoxidans]|nr:hypothetical protein HMPREF2772_18480 [Achromobacter xylosoxidans]